MQNRAERSGTVVAQTLRRNSFRAQNARKLSCQKLLIKIRKNYFAAGLRDVFAIKPAVNLANRRAGGSGVIIVGTGLRVNHDTVVIGVTFCIYHLVAELLIGILQAEIERPLVAAPSNLGVAGFIQRPVEDGVAVPAIIIVVVTAALDFAVRLIIIERQISSIIDVMTGDNLVITAARKRLEQMQNGRDVRAKRRKSHDECQTYGNHLG